MSTDESNLPGIGATSRNGLYVITDTSWDDVQRTALRVTVRERIGQAVGPRDVRAMRDLARRALPGASRTSVSHKSWYLGSQSVTFIVERETPLPVSTFNVIESGDTVSVMVTRPGVAMSEVNMTVSDDGTLTVEVNPSNQGHVTVDVIGETEADNIRIDRPKW